MRSREIIEFPANPFVALTDFLIMLMIILILVVLYQSINNDKFKQRIAIIKLQKDIRSFSEEGITDKKSLADSAKALKDAYKDGLFRESYVDGDLQRFWFDGSKCFKTNSAELSSERIKNIIYAFGYMLKYYQGDSKASLYKRIIVEGHAGEKECGGDEMAVWNLSQNRALRIIDAIHNSGVSYKKIEASARGCWGEDSTPNPDKSINMTPESISQRFDIIIIYSGKQAMDYINYQAKQMKTQKGIVNK